MLNLNITPEMAQEAERLSSFDLTVPETAVRNPRGDARWVEIATVEKAYLQDKTGKQGQTRKQMVIQTKLLPDADTPNAGKPYTLFILINEGVANGSQETLGDGDFKRETTMNNMSIHKLNQFGDALGLQASTSGISNETLLQLFPPEAEGTASAAVGNRIALCFVDKAGKKSYTGGNLQDVENILPIGEE